MSVFAEKFTLVENLGKWVKFTGSRNLEQARKYYSDFEPSSFPCLIRRIETEASAYMFIILERSDVNALVDKLNGVTPERPKGISHRMAKMLRIICESPSQGYTADYLMRQLYKTTQQPQKKVAGIYKDLRWLGRNGVLHEGGGGSAFKYTEVRFYATPITKQVAKSKQIPVEELDFR